MAGITGIKKAALLLMSLDPTYASDLLSVVKPQTATEIATEMAYLNTLSEEELSDDSHTVIVEFTELLSGTDQDWGLGFVKQMLTSAMGEEDSKVAFKEVEQGLKRRDPFAAIRSASIYEVFSTIEHESPQVIALVLSEMPAEASSDLVGMLEEEIRNDVIRGMAGATNVPVEAKVRVAAVIKKRLDVLRSGGGAAGNAKAQQIRKVSVLLRGLPMETRNAMLTSIKDQDQETGDMVMKMMVTWDDITIIAGRTLQEALRSADPRKLALAMVNASQRVNDKVKSNMSESARNMLYEESLLIASPSQKEIDGAREIILQDLRELNEAGMLEFEG